MKNGIFLLLGSNLGNRLVNLEFAKDHIAEDDIDIQLVSSIYSTKPWGVEDQPDFLNQVILIKTNHSPQALLAILLEIEQLAGRKRIEKWGPRQLDIDILFYNDEIVDTVELTIPHPELHLRRFTLVPLNEIASKLIHPVLKRNIAELLTDCPDKTQVLMEDTSASL